MALSRRFAWVAVLVGGVVLFELVRRALVQTQNPNLLPALLLVGATVVPVAFVTFWWGRRLASSVPPGLLAFTALVGGVVGVVVAGTLEFDTMRDLGTLPLVLVGLIEESAKLILPLAVLLLAGRRTSPSTGLLVGVASGAGFAALETMGYAFVTLISSRGDLSAVDGVLLLRGLMSPAAHMAWTGLTAAALWTAATQGWTGRAIGRLALVFVVCVALHTTWDSTGTIWAYAVLSATSLALLFATAHHLGDDAERRPVDGLARA
ncbi:PrsW family glutamic-type intramembrane protease [Solicola sp. PLA-1-18]|uniref:PrsW family glutamic-type intramembrane protease n=1 Tax=Solicola sp. PLA-1-18 TaxID=3380532 RepID=UPI003B764AA8